MLTVSGIEADYDGELISFDEANEILKRAEVRSLLHTSPSYSVERPRWRVLCPFSEELSPDRRSPMMARLNRLFGGCFSGESFALSQSYFYGSVGDNPPPRVEIISGTPIDLRADLDATQDPSLRFVNGSASTDPLAGSSGPPKVFSGHRSLNAAAQAGLTTDNSRSGVAFRLACEMRRQDASFETFCAQVQTDPRTASWYTEKGILNNNRELRRAWDKAGADTTVVDPGSGDGAVPLTTIPACQSDDAALTLMNRTFVFAHNWGGETLRKHRTMSA